MGEKEREDTREEDEGAGDGEPEGGEDVVPVVERRHRRHQDDDHDHHRHEEAVEPVYLPSVHLTLPC